MTGETNDNTARMPASRDPSVDAALADPASGGLVPGISTPAKGRRWLRITLQLVGFAAGLSLLGWVIAQAADDFDTERRAQLASAAWWQVAALVGLTAVSLGLNGAMWWLAIRPARRVSMRSCQATNAAASALAYLPMKLSILFRVASHARGDGVPVLVMGGWLGALAATMAAALGPMVLATIVVGRVDVLWWAIALGGAAVCVGVLVVLAKFVHTGRGWRWLESVLGMVLGDRGRRLAQSEHLDRLREGVVMLGDWRVVSGGAAMRIADALGFAGRFWLASRIAGEPIDVAAAVVGGVGYFVLGAAAPTGTVGVREGGTAGLFAVFGVEQMYAVIVVVSAVDAAVVVLLGLAGGAYAWPRIMRRRAVDPGAVDSADA